MRPLVIAGALGLVACGGALQQERAGSGALTSAELAAPAPPPKRPSPRIVTLPVEDAPLEQWSKRYPNAAFQLGSWVRQNPSTAADLFALDEREPENTLVLVQWAITHRYEPIHRQMATSDVRLR